MAAANAPMQTPWGDRIINFTNSTIASLTNDHSPTTGNQTAAQTNQDFSFASVLSSTPVQADTTTRLVNRDTAQTAKDWYNAKENRAPAAMSSGFGLKVSSNHKPPNVTNYSSKS